MGQCMSSHRSLAGAGSCLLRHFPFNKGVEDKSSFPFWTAGGCLLKREILYSRTTPCTQQCLLLSPGLSPKAKISLELEEGNGQCMAKDPSGMAVLNTQRHLSDDWQLHRFQRFRALKAGMPKRHWEGERKT